MLLPNAEDAWVPMSKGTRYLLNLEHAKGRSRAKFLIGFGFQRDAPENLRDALLLQARGGSASAREETVYGTIWNVVGPLPTPDRRNPIVTTAWIESRGDPRPRFITLTLKHPKGGRSDDS